MSPEKFTSDIKEAMQRSGYALSNEGYDEIKSTCELYLMLVDSEEATTKDLEEGIAALKAVVSNWGWDGNPIAAASFWDKAYDLAKPIGKEVLTIAVKLALKAAQESLS